MKIPKIHLRLILYIAFLSTSISTTVSIWYLINQPWFGFSLEYSGPENEQTGVRILNVFSESPSASKLYPGDVISGVISHGSVLRIPAYLRIDPNLISTYDAYSAFMQHNDELEEVVKNRTVTFLVNETNHVAVTAADKRPLYAVDWVVWYALLASPICFIAGVICYVRKPYNLVTFILFFLGLTTSLFMLSEVFLDREIFASANKILLGSIPRYITGTLYVFATVAVFFRWPYPILSKKILAVFFLLTCFVPINSYFQFVGLPFHERMGHILIYYLLLVLLFSIQWKKSKRDPVNRASLSLMLLSILIPVSISIVTTNIPIAMGAEPLLDTRVSLALNAPAIVIGWALAIFRYRLFDVEQWWFKSLLWIIGGLLVIIIDAGFVLFLHFSALQALPVALLVAGFLYFPIRQWLVTRSMGSRGLQLQALLPDFIKKVTIANTDSQYINQFQQLLREQFNSAHVELKECHSSHVEIQESGSSLAIPVLNSTQSLVLSGKNNAASLFNRRDKELLSSLTEIGDMANTAKRIRESAIYEERSRIMQDLHDTLGAKLLTLIHRCDDTADAESVREALQILRETVRYSQASQSILLDDLMAELRAESSERIRYGAAKLNWSLTLENTRVKLEPLLALVITNVVREGVSNAIKHGSGDTVWIDVQGSNKQLLMLIKNEIAETELLINMGTGLNGLQSRIRKQSGQIKMHHDSDDNGKRYFCLEVSVPLI